MNRQTTITKGKQKLISFSPRLYMLAEQRAKELGLPFAEYMRFLAANDVRSEYIPMVDEETNRRIGESLKAFKEGRYEVIDPSDPVQLAKAAGM